MSWLTGLHAIEERMKLHRASGSGNGCGPLMVAKAGPRARELVDLASACKIRIERVGSFDLDRLAAGNRGVALQVPEAAPGRESLDVKEFIAGLGEREEALVLILDEITDPHNYGAILRSCDQFGVDLVIGRNRRSAKNADIVAKTSAGTSAWVPEAETANLVRAARQLKDAGFWIYGADMAGKPAYEEKLRGRVALAMGSEGAGLSRLLLETCDGTVGIPSLGKIDSLNVSVAAGVLLYEVRRQGKSGK